MRELTREQLLNYRKGGFLTVGALKQMIEEFNYPDDAIIVVQRVEDKYYEGVDISGFSGCPDTEDGIFPPGSKSTPWGVYLKDGDSYRWAVEHNKKIDSGEFLNKENYPNITEEFLEKNPGFLKKYTEEELHQMKTQYHPIWGPVIYFEEKEILFLDLHY